MGVFLHNTQPISQAISCLPTCHPALVSNASDLVQDRVNDGLVVSADTSGGYVERYIHGEIYKHYPAIASVIHNHSNDIPPFAIAGMPLRAVYHMAGFFGPDTVPKEWWPSHVILDSTDSVLYWTCSHVMVHPFS